MKIWFCDIPLSRYHSRTTTPAKQTDHLETKFKKLFFLNTKQQIYYQLELSKSNSASSTSDSVPLSTCTCTLRHEVPLQVLHTAERTSPPSSATTTRSTARLLAAAWNHLQYFRRCWLQICFHRLQPMRCSMPPPLWWIQIISQPRLHLEVRSKRMLTSCTVTCLLFFVNISMEIDRVPY